MTMTIEEIKAIASKAAVTVLERNVEDSAFPNLELMAEWIKGEEPGTCRTCIIGPVIQWYYEELKERGYDDIAAQLKAEVDVQEEDNVEQLMALCKDLDDIKASAPEELRKRLEEFDISIQSLDPSDFSSEALPGGSPSSSQPHAHSSDSVSESPLSPSPPERRAKEHKGKLPSSSLHR